MRTTRDITVQEPTYGKLNFAFRLPYGANLREALLAQFKRRLGADVTIWWATHRTEDTQKGRVQWFSDDIYHEAHVVVA